MCSSLLTGAALPLLPSGAAGAQGSLVLGAAQAGEPWQGTDTAGMKGPEVKAWRIFTFYLFCYSILSPGEEIRLPPQEAEEGVHELGNREREQRKGPVSPGHSKSPGVSGAAFILCPPYLWLCQHRPGISPVTAAHRTLGWGDPAPGFPACRRSLCGLLEERQQFILSSCSHTPSCYLR